MLWKTQKPVEKCPQKGHMECARVASASDSQCWRRNKSLKQVVPAPSKYKASFSPGWINRWPCKSWKQECSTATNCKTIYVSIRIATLDALPICWQVPHTVSSQRMNISIYIPILHSNTVARFVIAEPIYKGFNDNSVLPILSFSLTLKGTNVRLFRRKCPDINVRQYKCSAALLDKDRGRGHNKLV